MTRRQVIRHLLLGVGALACLACAAFLFTLAADVDRVRAAIVADDVTYRTAPDAGGLWHTDALLPGGAAESVLDVDDDVAFREALRALRLSRLDLGITSDPELALRRGEARALLQGIAGSDDDAKSRARAMGLLGVLSFAASLSDARDQALHIQDAATAFQGAIALDPTGSEPKANLELSLQRGRAVQPQESGGGQNPSPGGAGAKGAGVGDPGSGY